MANETRLNIRLSEEENKRIKDFCDEKGIKSKSKVGKQALNFVLNGKSDIDFGIKSNFENEPQKELQVSNEGKSKCPHCAGAVSLDPGHEKHEKEIVVQNFIPGFRCNHEECDKIHENSNYLMRPIGICSKCNQFSNRSFGSCSWCNNENSLVSTNDFKLDELNIPKSNFVNI
ncbi:MAG: hypothetical protein QQN45_07475 [Nitrosopumilus sp.]